jgi:hypothetical protein
MGNDRFLLFVNADKLSATPEDRVDSFNSLELVLKKAREVKEKFMIIVDRWQPLNPPLILTGEEIEYWTTEELTKIFSGRE